MKEGISIYRYTDGSICSIRTEGGFLNICPEAVEKWCELKRHILIGETIEGVLEVKFTLTKTRKKKK